MLSSGFENVSRIFFLTSKPLNTLAGTLIFFRSLLNTLFLLLLAVSKKIPSVAPILLHFHLQKHYSYFVFSFLTTVDHFQFSFRGFCVLNTYIVPSIFVDRDQKRDSYISEITLTSKNFSASDFGICLSLHMFFPPFSGILT